ncbi:hypothetical protein AA15669_1982 [Saccharibacter floricola DSM 15669]|uniref:Uncharacterized protein n=2 Tax=Saccharibacter TaxID=231052 RepID=A0ABQ0P1A8_9PROT|nr:hypothetical protein AA15669_1982 [Saccharibacter floricola DSM 15669]
MVKTWGPSGAELLEAARCDPRNRRTDIGFLGRLLGKQDDADLEHWVPRPMLKELDLWAAQKGIGRAKALKLLLGKGVEAEKTAVLNRRKRSFRE